MSTLYLSSDPRSLAEKLAGNLDRQAKHGDFFVPTTIVVPNRYLRKWLRLHLARRLDVAINLNFVELDDALWQLLENTYSTPCERIDTNLDRLMVLAVLLQEDDPALAPLRRYLQLPEQRAGSVSDGHALSRLTSRRAWYLADRLGTLLREYELHRQDGLIQPWLHTQFGLSNVSEFHAMMEAAQRALFLHITREPDGKRALLNQFEGATFKSLPQLALDCMAQRKVNVKAMSNVHFFGFTHLADLQVKAIAWLGEHCDIKMYHLNAIANRADDSLDAASLQRFALRFRDTGASATARDPGMELLRLWGRAGGESLTLIARLLDSPAFNAEWLPAVIEKGRGKRRTTVLARLHDHLLGTSAAKTIVEQDTSLQIVGCPGMMREVETAYHSILANLSRDPTLRQTDIAVLVSDMTKYRPTLQAVFERPPLRLTYNLVDYSAASTSVFGQALLGMLDLALDSFARSRVFQVILNPCFLARLGADRSQALAWLEWADRLGIYQGWDADEKHAQGYPRSPFYAWKLGLQRLRLGRYMDVADQGADGPAMRFGHVIPFADLASSDREQLDAFCLAVEGLLPTLARLRTMEMSGERWANTLERLVQDFLAVPADRPEEERVREQLLGSLRTLARWDALSPPLRKGGVGGMPMTLVREYVQSQLNDLHGSHGEYLTGGVTISALQPMRPVPFAIVYVLGLGDDLFPGTNSLSSFDLRGAQRVVGDIRPAEQKLYDFLSTILSAQQKLYLLYSSHDLQKDQPLLPAVPLQQLQRYVGTHLVNAEFKPTIMPTDPADVRYLDAAQQPAYQDVLVQYREADRCLTLRAHEARLALDLTQQQEWAETLQRFQQDFALPATPASATRMPINVSLIELKRFLQLPAHASLRRHLRIDEDDEPTGEDDEPLVTPQRAAYNLLRQTLEQVVLSAVQGDVEKTLASWQDRFTQTYADSRLRSQVPEEAFGEIDQSTLRRDLIERIHGQGQIEAFLRQHAGMTFCGPILLGESMTPIGAKLHFPALRFRLGDEASPEVRIVGSTPFAWHAPDRVELLILTNSKDIDGRKIAPASFDPMLFLLALHANAEPNAEGMSSQSWLARRICHIHVAHGKGIQTWVYPAGSITTTEALQYLVELTRDFLDPTQFDLLPFEMLQENLELARACDSIFNGQISPDDYRELFEEKLAEARENKKFSKVKIPLLVEMVNARVPQDALAKVQRRFRLLDRGPARVRQQPVTRGKRVPKS